MNSKVMNSIIILYAGYHFYLSYYFIGFFGTLMGFNGQATNSNESSHVKFRTVPFTFEFMLFHEVIFEFMSFDQILGRIHL